jgi:hypothetical protein
VRVKAAPPATADAGLMLVTLGAGSIVKTMKFELPPPGGGLKTVTLAEPAAAISLAGIAAFSCVELTTVVVLFAPFHRTTDPPTKLKPDTVKVNPGLPARAELGLILVILGSGLPCPRAESENRQTSPTSTRTDLPSIDLYPDLASFMIAFSLNVKSGNGQPSKS